MPLRSRLIGRGMMCWEKPSGVIGYLEKRMRGVTAWWRIVLGWMVVGDLAMLVKLGLV